jgi:LDH2 family malate/lactate/ureidoglycolate dehydrogenase
MLDVVCGVLSAGRFAANLGDTGSAHFFQAMKVDTFIPLTEFQAKMGALIEQMYTTPLAPGFDRVFLPGEIEYNLTVDRQKNGIPTEAPILDQLEGFAAEVGAANRPSRW